MHTTPAFPEYGKRYDTAVAKLNRVADRAKKSLRKTLRILHDMDNLYRSHTNMAKETGGTIRGVPVAQWEQWIDSVVNTYMGDDE